MCGICGIVGTADAFEVSASVVERMTATLAHRGPDDSGTWQSPDGRVALGLRRLAIVDLSPAGHQPMSNEDGTIWITYNGEIYNHSELRRELEAKGHRYRSQSDTETILHLYEEEGVRCVERLHGMFGLAIWDGRRRELFLARDRLGIKPVYYSRPGGGFVFGSEIKALFEHPSVRRELDEQALSDYLTFVCTPAPQTMFQGIEKLAPGERMIVRSDGSVRREIYWTPFSETARVEVEGMTDDELEKRLLELLRESIRKRMMSDVPFGVFLSGGIDSSTNVALMSELMDEPVRTFSVGFAGHAAYNELEHARRIAKHFATDHHEVVIDVGDLESFLPEMIYHQDEPIADWVCVPLHYLSKLARATGTIVVQVGEGADELLHGYDGYIEEARFARRYGSLLRSMPRAATGTAARVASGAALRLGRGATTAHRIGAAASGGASFWGGAIAFRGELKDRIVANGDYADASRVIERVRREARLARPDLDPLQEMTYVELKVRLAELLLMRVDKMTMANSVEARVPFLDHDLVEFAVALPARAKVRDGVGKYILKRAVRDLLPAETIARPKQGFSAPVAEWFRGPLGVRARAQIRESSLAERGLLDYDAIDRLWEAHRSGRGNWSFQLWNLYNVSAWHDYWIANRAVA